MNISELSEELRRLGIPTPWFLIGDKGDSHDKTCLKVADGKWCVYYSERGGKYKLVTFDSEDAACHELLSRMKEKKDWHKRQKDEENR